MKIQKIKINAFGNLENKEIEFSEHINIVQGKNESGKSTLLKFVTNMFYGISKNKRGKEFSDYERYKPWSTEEFSGKIQYTLDNQKQFEVFRDFTKKNPKIYNESREEISANFDTNKTNGSQFFYEQTKIEEEMFLSSFVSLQQEVKLEKTVQNTMIQKLSNLAGTGEENVSYKKAIDKLNKKQVEEIGNSRTQERPINLLEKKQKEVEREYTTIGCFNDKKYQIEIQKHTLQELIQKEEEKLVCFEKIEKIEIEQKIIKEKIKIKEEIQNNTKEKINQLIKEKNIVEENKKDGEEEITINLKNKKNKILKVNKINILLFIILLIVIVLNLSSIKNNIINIVLGIILIMQVIFFSILIFQAFQKTKQINKINEKIKIIKNKNAEVIGKIKNQIEILEKNNQEEQKEIQKIREENDLKNNLQLQEIKNNNKIINQIDIQNIQGNITEEIKKIRNKINENKLELHRIALEEGNIIPKLEQLSELEEEKAQIVEEKENLLKDNVIIELAKSAIYEAYEKMKQNVSPKFAKNLSENIANISKNKYKNVRINDEEGIIVEKENGEYITAERLSVGTIDQLYLSLRLAIAKEVGNETMPILLDETFAYYDTERLTNLLKYIDKEFPQSQIIIFTCTNREKEIVEKEQIKHKSIIL